MIPKIALRGSAIGSVKELKASDKRAIIAPRIITAGRRILWSPVWNIFRARWGTKTPKNATGPQNEVTRPESMAVKKIRPVLIFFIDRPELWAYRSPRSRMFNGLESRSDSTSPIKEIEIKILRSSKDTLWKLPWDQRKKLLSSFALLKRLIILISPLEM